MRFSRCIFPLLAVFVCLGLGASAHPGETEWRAVTPEELAMKTPKVEPDADAEAIFWEVRIDDSSEDLSMQHYVRVKVFNDRGREKYSKLDIPFTRKMKIKDIAARVIKPDGTPWRSQSRTLWRKRLLRRVASRLRSNRLRFRISKQARLSSIGIAK
jgi:hypothetical protein